MATTRKAASRGAKSKAKKPSTSTAARAETNGKKDGPAIVKFHNLELELPEKLPETVIFDITDLEAGVSMEDPRPMFRLLRSVVGPEQFLAIRHVLEAEQLSVGEEVLALMSDVLGEYGLSAGES